MKGKIIEKQMFQYFIFTFILKLYNFKVYILKVFSKAYVFLLTEHRIYIFDFFFIIIKAYYSCKYKVTSFLKFRDPRIFIYYFYLRNSSSISFFVCITQPFCIRRGVKFFADKNSQREFFFSIFIKCLFEGNTLLGVCIFYSPLLCCISISLQRPKLYTILLFHNGNFIVYQANVYTKNNLSIAEKVF